MLRLAAKVAGTCADARLFSTARKSGKVLVILGPPGGGKGTISKKIMRDFPISHLSTGDILRTHIASKTELGVLANSYVSRGDLVPDSVMVSLVQQELRRHSGDTHWLLDGFPRTLQQAKALAEPAVGVAVDYVIHLDIPKQTIVERISNRWIHAPSGRVYAYDYNPPKERGKDDVTGEPLVQRDDDKPETVAQRLDKYAQMTAPLVEFYSQPTGDGRKRLVTFAGTESDVIYPQVKAFLESVLLAEKQDDDGSGADGSGSGGGSAAVM